MASQIISADDFGKSEAANRNILQLAAQGRLQRVSVLVNGIFGQPEIKTLKLAGVKLDLHLLLPETDYHNDKRKTFSRLIIFFFWLLTGKINQRKVKPSWEGQIRQFKKIFGRLPDGLNSHEHVHFFPLYLKIALHLAQEYQIKYIRFGKKGIIANRKLVSQILNQLNRLDCKHFAASEINSSDYLVSLDWDNHSLDSYTGSIELVCHPERKEEYQLIRKLIGS
jgi:predicted glycoside hydrolase/deacetylase ChbG (UPF0249 family)